MLLMVLVITGCGQPLQIDPTNAIRPTLQVLQPTLRPTLVTPSVVANDVPTPNPLITTTQELSPEPTTLGATATLTPTLVASPTPAIVVVPQTPIAQDNEQRWRAQQQDRQVLERTQTYIARNPVPLLWYDPLTGQSLDIGTLIGEFTVQARFVLRSKNALALEVPYRINADYGLTSISEALLTRMREAKYQESVEAYVMQTEDVAPK
jgi:hypothetical protein